MEMYLAQMIVFRAVEKLHLIYVFGDTGVGGWVSFLFVFAITVFGLICFIECYKKIIGCLKNMLNNVLSGSERS